MDYKFLPYTFNANVEAMNVSAACLSIRAGGTGPAAPVLAGPIFEAPTIFFN